jgi:lysophospholipase L1-like esterase
VKPFFFKPRTLQTHNLFAAVLLLSCASSPEDSDDSTDDAAESAGGSASGGSASGGSASGGGTLASAGGVTASGDTLSGGGGATGTGGGSSAGGSLPMGAGGTVAATGGAESDSGGTFNGSGGSAEGAGGSGELPLGPVTVFIAGDSTVSEYADTVSESDQAGWGQMLHEHYDERVTIENHAIGGRSARRFIDEGRLDAIWNEISAGDFLLVQFGTNDGHKTATYEIDGQTIPYYLDPSTDFKTYLQMYIDGARERDVHIVLVTPPPRNSAYCTGGNGTGAHAEAMRELGAVEGIDVSDLNKKSVDYLIAICPAPTPEDFFLLRTDGTVDGTHFQENGARILSSLVAAGIGELGVVLDGYRL